MGNISIIEKAFFKCWYQFHSTKITDETKYPQFYCILYTTILNKKVLTTNLFG